MFFYSWHKSAVQGGIENAFSFSLVLASAIYLALWSIRAFTLVPSTYVVLVALPFFPPVLLFGLTLIGVLISSTIIYQFSRALGLREVFEHGRYKPRVDQLRAVLDRHQWPILIGWSFFPLTPTDVICYVAGMLEINFAKFLVAILVGKGAICAIYIFGGEAALRLLQLKG